MSGPHQHGGNDAPECTTCRPTPEWADQAGMVLAGLRCDDLHGHGPVALPCAACRSWGDYAVRRLPDQPDTPSVPGCGWAARLTYPRLGLEEWWCDTCERSGDCLRPIEPTPEPSPYHPSNRARVQQLDEEV